MAELQDSDSDGYIKIQFQQDTFIVHTQIGGSHENNTYIEFITESKSLYKIY
jgi:hypothetical protein